MRVLVVDNTDSFVYNLVQYLGMLEADPVVADRDTDVGDLDAYVRECEAVVLSPGPGKPADAYLSNHVLDVVSEDKPLLGVCLGHQCIIEHFGGKVGYAKDLVHGKTSMVAHDGSILFKDVENPFEATRYHSLAGLDEDIPDDIKVTARTGDGEVMAVMHMERPVFGVQFHPESILTKEGLKILRNFLEASK